MTDSRMATLLPCSLSLTEMMPLWQIPQPTCYSLKVGRWHQLSSKSQRFSGPTMNIETLFSGHLIHSRAVWWLWIFCTCNCEASAFYFKTELKNTQGKQLSSSLIHILKSLTLQWQQCLNMLFINCPEQTVIESLSLVFTSLLANLIN